MIKFKSDMRYVIGVTWIVSFIAMWFIFNTFIPEDNFRNELVNIEEHVSKKNWHEAKKSMTELKKIYNSKKTLIHANNATEILTTFDLTMGQLDISVQHEQDSALEYIGGLKSSLDFVMKAFSGP